MTGTVASEDGVPAMAAAPVQQNVQMATAGEAKGEPVAKAAADVEEAASQGRSLGTMDLVLVALVALTVSTVVMFGGWYFLGQKQAFAVIDLPGIIEVEQLIFQSNLMKKGVNDSDRATEYERVKTFGPRLESAIAEVRKNCNCIVLSRGAFVGQTKDVTNDVRAILGTDKVNVEELKLRIQREIEGSMPMPAPAKK